jgi:anti-sigma B factor antagonist
MNREWQVPEQRENPAVLGMNREPKLKLTLETRNRGEVLIVHCQGRIVYRDEAAALSRFVSELLGQTRRLILDLSGVSSMDSAGIGELASLRAAAQEKNVEFMCAGANQLIRTLLDLTNLDTVMEVHPSVDAALLSLQEEQVCLDC